MKTRYVQPLASRYKADLPRAITLGQWRSGSDRARLGQLFHIPARVCWQAPHWQTRAAFLALSILAGGSGGACASALATIPCDEIQHIFDGEQQHPHNQDRACGFERDPRFSGDTATLSRKARSVKDYVTLVTVGLRSMLGHLIHPVARDYPASGLVPIRCFLSQGASEPQGQREAHRELCLPLLGSVGSTQTASQLLPGSPRSIQAMR